VQLILNQTFQQCLYLSHRDATILCERETGTCGIPERITKKRTGINHHVQGSQFTSTDFIKVLASREIKISMDGKGAWRDNVFVERLWRIIKYEEVYLHTYASVPEAHASRKRYLSFYNSRRPHSSLDGKTPDQAYFNQQLPDAVAA
jgi:transposase InsO family protein